MKLLLTLACSAICLTGFAKKENTIHPSISLTELQNDTTVYEFTVVSKMAEYKGGMQQFHKDLKNIVVYPKEAKAAGHRGTVFLSCIVELDGSISTIKVMRKLGRGCDEAAVNALKKMSFSKPAYLNDKPVRMLLNLPVGFGI